MVINYNHYILYTFVACFLLLVIKSIVLAIRSQFSSNNVIKDLEDEINIRRLNLENKVNKIKEEDLLRQKENMGINLLVEQKHVVSSEAKTLILKEYEKKLYRLQNIKVYGFIPIQWIKHKIEFGNTWIFTKKVSIIYRIIWFCLFITLFVLNYMYMYNWDEEIYKEKSHEDFFPDSRRIFERLNFVIVIIIQFLYPCFAIMFALKKFSGSWMRNITNVLLFLSFIQTNTLLTKYFIWSNRFSIHLSWWHKLVEPLNMTICCSDGVYSNYPLWVLICIMIGSFYPLIFEYNNNTLLGC